MGDIYAWYLFNHYFYMAFRNKNSLFYVFLTVHLDTHLQWKPTWCIIYPQFISSVNLYMFRAYL